MVIKPDIGYSVAIFNVKNGREIEAFVVSDDGEETTRLRFEGPDEAYGVVVEYDEFSNETRIVYKARPIAVLNTREDPK